MKKQTGNFLAELLIVAAAVAALYCVLYNIATILFPLPVAEQEQEWPVRAALNDLIADEDASSIRLNCVETDDRYILTSTMLLNGKTHSMMSMIGVLDSSNRQEVMRMRTYGIWIRTSPTSFDIMTSSVVYVLNGQQLTHDQLIQRYGSAPMPPSWPLHQYTAVDVDQLSDEDFAVMFTYTTDEDNRTSPLYRMSPATIHCSGRKF